MTLLEVAKHALEAMEDAMYRADTHEFYDAKESLRYAIEQAEQAEQEPVAWADDVGAVIPHSHKLFVPGLCKNYTRPLYAAPTKWKELTLEELDAIGAVYMEKDRTIQAWGCFAQAIEDKLKEKNT